MEMHHGENEDDIFILGINNAIWKTPGLVTTDVTFKNSPSSWETENILDCGVYFNGEIVTETRLTLLILAYGVEKFSLSFRVKGILHLENRLSALSNTSSPGIGFTFPERSSWSRLFATSAHFSSIPLFGLLRLRRSESAISARSSTGRERTSSMIFLVVMVI